MTNTPQQRIADLIPHRPPFLWLDRIVHLGGGRIEAEKWLDPALDVFAGHYPHYPIMPGVLLCESVFQAGAVLIASNLDGVDGLPVLTRIQDARFKREAGPGDMLRIEARLDERVGPAWFLRGSIRVRGQIALRVRFACTLKTDDHLSA